MLRRLSWIDVISYALHQCCKFASS